MAEIRPKRFHCPRHWTLQQRLDHYSIPEPNTGCLLWLGNVVGSREQKYGRLGYKGKARLAPKLSWEQANGRPMPVGMMACHKCDMTLCIEPTHIYPGTHAQNMADMVRRNRHNQGVRHGNAKLTDDIVRAIRAAPRPYAPIAAKYGISEQLVSDVRRGHRWAHVLDTRDDRSAGQAVDRKGY